jgi:hypothetical protein
MALIPTNVSTVNANRFFAVCFALYGLQFLCMPEKFLSMYWTAGLAAPLISFLTRSIGLMMLAYSATNWRYQGSTGITFFNLFMMLVNIIHCIEVLFWNLYAESLWIEQKQMWQIQVALSFVFVWVAYSGWSNSDKNAEYSAPAASADVKSIGSWQVSGYNVNRLMGVFMGIYGVAMLCDPVMLLSHYFAPKSLHFPLFAFLTRMMGTIMLSSSAACWNYAGAESLNFTALVNMFITVIHFAVVLWGGSIEPENLGGTENMWYAQMVINLIMVAIAYFGYKDAKERGVNAAAASSTASAADPAPGDKAGSML